ncbi:hypothetical protein [Escherichia coli]|uniref:hypothetical protein n=2 Tax=Escherichia coli TaxID=562 RepID=UPI00135D3304|nr:hypothetical protein [Escherichia coli]MXF08894.1 hypothetical protein [Escherichia coli]
MKLKSALGLLMVAGTIAGTGARVHAEIWAQTEPAIATVKVSALQGLEIKPGAHKQLPLRLDVGTVVGEFEILNTSTADIEDGRIGVTAGAAKYMTSDGKSLLFVKKDDESQHIAVTVAGAEWKGPEVHNGVSMWVLGSKLAKGASSGPTSLSAVSLTTNTPGEYETQLQATLNNN